MTKPVPTKITGIVEHTHYCGPKFTAGRLRTNQPVEHANGSGLISFAVRQQVEAGSNVTLHGEWIKHKKYGWQFEASAVEHTLQFDVDGLAHWLSKHKDIKGIGPAKARKLAEHYGDTFGEAITNRPREVAAIAGISQEQTDGLRAVWIANQEYVELITWLGAYGLSIHEIDTLRVKWGHNTAGILKNDPYQMIGALERFGFKRADNVCLKMGKKKADGSRIQQGIIWCVKQAMDDGSTMIEKRELVRTANKLLEIDDIQSVELIRYELGNLIAAQRLDEIIVPGTDERLRVDWILLPKMRLKEEFIFDALCGAAEADKNPHFSADEDSAHQEIDEEISMIAPTLNEQQRRAVINAIEHPISLLSGGAGTGKTYTINAIRLFYEQNDKVVLLLAPTGKAARRLEESTGHEAATIHRGLDYGYVPGMGMVFRKNERDPLDADLVVIDEFSMVDTDLAYALFRAIDLTTTAVVICGDHNQLPPVGPGDLLRILINSSLLPHVVLTEVVRQAGLLKKNCTQLLHGIVEYKAKEEGEGVNANVPWQVINNMRSAEEAAEFVVSAFRGMIQRNPNLNVVTDVQLLIPQRKGPLGCADMNGRLQAMIQRERYGVEVEQIDDTKKGKKGQQKKRLKFLPHDKIIWTHNDYETGLMNGTIGQVVDRAGDGGFLIQFEGEANPIEIPSKKLIFMELAYAITIHKFQGSECPFVILVIHRQHTYMLHRGIFYTGATRAKRKLVVVGDRWSIPYCAKTVKVQDRRTWFGGLVQRREAKDKGIDNE